jgi:hypothetical protein
VHGFSSFEKHYLVAIALIRLDSLCTVSTVVPICDMHQALIGSVVVKKEK